MLLFDGLMYLAIQKHNVLKKAASNIFQKRRITDMIRSADFPASSTL